MVEYETTHRDAGDNYAHLVAEDWDALETRDLIEGLYRNWETLGIHPRWKDIEPDVLADIALESFTMESGSAYHKQSGIVLDAFLVGEIEIDISNLGIDGITIDYIREACEAYMSGNDYAFVSTDAAWYAVLDVPMFNAQIEQYVNDKESE
jgi:hypothetical protein